MKINNRKWLILVSVLEVSLNISCKKFVTVDPPVTQLTGASVFATDATATSVITGLYTNLSQSVISSTGLTSMSYFPGLSADELSLFSGDLNTSNVYYANALTSSNEGGIYWGPIYSQLFTINSAIEGLIAAKSLSPSVKQQLLGEAKFMRSFLYFYLTNLYGDVPLELSTDYTVNSLFPRTEKAKVYSQIIEDLKDAQSLLNTNYVDATIQKITTERVRPTSWAATALLARVYLYYGSLADAGNYANAEAQATTIINNLGLFRITSLDSVFLKNNAEAIWQLQPVFSNQNTNEGVTFILPASPPYSGLVYLNNQLMEAFETGDERKIKWTNTVMDGGITYYYPFKYKINSSPGVTSVAGLKEYSVVFRLAEQYLIRAEARARQSNILGSNGALADLNVLRSRAGLPNYSGPDDQASVISAVLHERQVELFTEWGHRWLDLKRSGTIDDIMTPACIAKGTTWHSYQQFYPIPFQQMQANPKLVQNPSY